MLPMVDLLGYMTAASSLHSARRSIALRANKPGVGRISRLALPFSNLGNSAKTYVVYFHIW